MAWTDEIRKRRDDSKRRGEQFASKHKEAFDRLCPMVTRLLDELGDTLYGRNFWGKRKYVVNTSKNDFAWNLYFSDNDMDSLSRCLQVCKTGEHFSLYVSHGGHIMSQQATSDTSEEQLKQAMIDLQHYL